jgi:hypothetical protein
MPMSHGQTFNAPLDDSQPVTYTASNIQHDGQSDASRPRLTTARGYLPPLFSFAPLNHSNSSDQFTSGTQRPLHTSQLRQAAQAADSVVGSSRHIECEPSMVDDAGLLAFYLSIVTSLMIPQKVACTLAGRDFLALPSCLSPQLPGKRCAPVRLLGPRREMIGQTSRKAYRTLVPAGLSRKLHPVRRCPRMSLVSVH